MSFKQKRQISPLCIRALWLLPLLRKEKYNSERQAQDAFLPLEGTAVFTKQGRFPGWLWVAVISLFLLPLSPSADQALMKPPFNPREFETWGMLLTTFISSFKKSNSNNKILPAVYHCCSCLSLFIVKGLLGRAVDSPAHHSSSLPQWRTLLGSCMWSTPNREDNLTAFWDISSLTSETWLSDFSYAFSS